MSELGFLCPEQRLADFLQKKTLSVLYIISTIAKFSRQAWQNWILSVHGNFLKELDSARKNLVFSWSPDIGRNQREVLKKFFQQDCQNCIFRFRRITLMEHIPWRSFFLLSLWDIERKNFSFLTKDFQQGFKGRFLRLQENLLKSIFRRN